MQHAAVCTQHDPALLMVRSQGSGVKALGQMHRVHAYGHAVQLQWYLQLTSLYLQATQLVLELAFSL